MLQQPERITASHRGMLRRVARQNDPCRVPGDLQKFPHVAGADEPRLIHPNHLSARFRLELRIGKQVRQRLGSRKPGFAQRSSRSRRRRCKGEHPAASGLDLRHRFTHRRRFADACPASNSHHLIATVENMPDRLPLLRRKQLIGESDVPPFERGIHPATTPHRVDERNFLSEHLDRSAKLFARNFADDHPAPLKFAPCFFRRELPDAKTQGFGDQSPALNDRTLREKFLARVIERHFRRHFFASRRRLTLRRF